MPSTMRHLLAGAAVLLLAAAPAGAQTYPAKPVRLVVPFPAGSTTDLVGRILAQKLGPALGEQVVIDNRGGSGGTIGTEHVARSAPDGYTLLMATIGTHAINPALYKKITYDAVKDFAPVAQFGTAPNVLVVNPSVPVNSLAELVAYSRARPGEMNYGSSGNGTSNHLSGAMLASREKLDMVHVPYRGGAQAIEGLLRGDLKLMFYHYLPLLPFIEDGKLRPLAVTGAERVPALKSVPTMGEAGAADFVVSAWFGVYAPAGTPPVIVDRLNKEITGIMASADMRETLMKQGVDPVSGSPEDLATLMKAELVRWAAIVKAAGAQVD
ncbi:tripartite-type tricarboxylate transporter receptor subunit TctC [Stella humosa]|uniref:Tripartite-type tricarboxylate transporter receptor subunit TctC n=2 Tax=Stella humosa TaxID=94 RepID=A0A3N1MKK3_9PROT|nr:tripartite-type tricarboxylate transporter receptor subunit TctC [Stella humosa]